MCGCIQKLDFVIANQKKKKKKKEAIIQMKNVNVICNAVLWLSLQVIKHLILNLFAVVCLYVVLNAVSFPAWYAISCQLFLMPKGTQTLSNPLLFEMNIPHNTMWKLSEFIGTSTKDLIADRFFLQLVHVVEWKSQ